MNASCLKNGIRLILLDLPQPSDEAGEFIPSLPSDVAPVFATNSYAAISSEAALGAYRHTAESRLPHGQRHISEFTHLTFGMAAGQAVLDAYRQSN